MKGMQLINWPVCVPTLTYDQNETADTNGRNELSSFFLL